MNERLKRISRLLSSGASRASYIRAKLNVLIPSQIRGLRLKRPMTQRELADSAKMKQSRISAMERPGEVQFNLETLVRLAAAFKVGLKVEFVPFSEMLAWENGFSQDQFNPIPIDNDRAFLNPAIVLQGQPVQPTIFFPLSTAATQVGANRPMVISTGMITGFAKKVDLTAPEQLVFQYLFGTHHQAEEEIDILTNAEYQDVPLAIAATAGASNMSLYSSGAP